MKKQLCFEISRGLLILLFAYAGITKLLGHQSFQMQLIKHPLFRDVSVITAWAVPAAELVIALLLSFPAVAKAGLWLSLLLLSSFTFYIVYMIVFYPALPCSCGGVIGRLGWRGHVYFNLFFIVVNMAAITFKERVATSGPVRRAQDYAENL